MDSRRHPLGNTTAVVLVIVLVLAGIGYWWYYTSRPNPNTNHANTNTANVNSDVPTAPSITSDSDLSSAEAALDQVNLNDTSAESSQLTTYSAEF